tara:strand:- start:3759 stop:5648 length:1890 start_codon:yes stop_codon:yes gene_type:complete
MDMGAAEMPASSMMPFSFKLFGLTFLVLSAAFCAIWSVSLYLAEREENQQHHIAAADAVRTQREVVEEAIKTFSADLRVAAGLQSLRRFVSGDASFLDTVAADFRLFADANALIAQLRFIDREGVEQIRIDRWPRQRSVAVVTELQNKALRYYFTKSINLPKGGLYLSAMDLNVEFHQVETPWRPMIRLATPVYSDQGGVAGIVVMNLDAERLLDSFEKVRLSDNVRIQLLNADGYWLAGVPVNRLWGFMFGREDTMAKSDPNAWGKIAAAAEGEFEHDGQWVFFTTVTPEDVMRPAGRDVPVVTEDAAWKIVSVVPGVTFPALWKGNHPPVAIAGLIVIGLISFVLSQAVSRRRDAETANSLSKEEMARYERMASLGSLVAGVAHELNTPVGTSVTVASTLFEKTKEFDAAVTSGELRRSVIDAFLTDTREGMMIILKGLRQAHELIGHFKQVAVDQTSEQRRHFMLGDLLKDVSASLQNQFRQGHISLETEVETSTEMDSFPGLLSQVLINLVENARLHAFAGRVSGKVVLHVWKHKKGYVQIDVRDNGCGIEPDVIGRIFEPFFSTQLGRGGSGLGLSIAYNIVTASLGGSIRAESAPGEGTTIIVRLPVTAPAIRGGVLGRTYDV